MTDQVTLSNAPTPTEKPRDTDRIFMSYSRTEMYYAEALTLSLQRAGLNMWFDLQQLEPGCIWLDEIQKGLDDCNQLVVVASETALSSPWVIQEWHHALDKQIPIHVVLFEAITLDERTIMAEDGDEITVDPASLINQATSIIDGRGAFNATVDKLILALQGDYAEKAQIPTPNNWKIPTHVPPSVGFVAFGMGILALFLAWLTIQSVSIFLPATVAGAVLTVLSVLELRNFLTRKSFRGTRTSLLFASIVTPIFFPLLAVIFFIAWGVSIFSLDVNRWSPRGEGARRGEMSNWLLLRHLIHNSLGIYRWYASKRFVFKILIFVLFVGANFIFAVVIESNLPNRRMNDTQALLSFMPSLLLVLATLASWILPLLQRNEKNKTVAPTGKTFRVLYNLDDAPMADMVAETMLNVGHNRVISRSEEVDYNVLIASNRLTRRDFQEHIDKSGRWIVLVVSNLEEQVWFEDLQDFQWVDFRKQDRQQLEIMVDELRETQYDIVSHSFSTRVTPQSFTKLVLPRAVQIFVILQILGLSSSLAVTLGIATRITQWDMLLILTLTYQIMSSLISVAITVRVMYQDITVDTIVSINLVVGVIGYFLGLFVGISQLPARFVIDGGRLITAVGLQMVGFAIGFYLGRYILKAWLGRWLPAMTGTVNILELLWDRYRHLYVRSFAIMAVVLLLVMSLFTATPNPDSDSWRNRMTSPISMMLRNADSPLSDGIANFFDSLINT